MGGACRAVPYLRGFIGGGGDREAGHWEGFAGTDTPTPALQSPGRMKLVVLDNYEAVSIFAAEYVAKRINEFAPTPDRLFVLGLPTGGSPTHPKPTPQGAPLSACTSGWWRCTGTGS